MPKSVLRMDIDEDVLAWLKSSCRAYHVRANQLLRERMLQDMAENGQHTA
jgi:uncharacterized protein (DUF4415 family)